MEKLRLGISACLLGEAVRYDGNHKHDPFLTGTLGQHVEFVPVCPEAESGMGIPREAMRLEGDPASPRLITIHSRIDKSRQLIDWNRRKLKQLDGEALHGYIFKAKSPSCGMERVKVYGEKGMPAHKGAGLFARALMERWPLLPVEEEGRLQDPKLRENFIERLFVHQRWQEVTTERFSPHRLEEFHRRHKLLIMAHSPRHYRELGRLAAEDQRPPKERLAAYAQGLQEALRLQATPKKNANVLQHIQGYFKRQLSTDEKAELGELIDAYRQELMPLIVPVTLLNHYVRKYDETYLKEQWYLNPHPLELKLRNHC